MKLFFSVLILMTISFTSSAGGDWNPSGLWRGVDIDGGFSFRQFIETDEPGVFAFAGGDDWHGPCGYGWPASVTGEVEIERGSYYPVQFNGTWYLDCQAPPTDASGDRSFGVLFELDVRKEEVTEILLDAPGGEPIGRKPIVYRRVSE